MLKAENLRAGYGGDDAVRGISITVAEGSCVALVGANGAGKSTLAKALCGLLTPREGDCIKCSLQSRFGDTHVAYFSMEIGIRGDIPTYSGGLGVLAGDFLRSAADLNIPMIGITLLYKKGYFKQRIVDGSQIEEEVVWDPKEHLELLPEKISLKIEDSISKMN